MQTFGYYNRELEVNVKFKQLDPDLCMDFVNRYEELPRKEYIFTVLNAAVANIDSEVRPALAGLTSVQANETLIALYNGCVMLNPVLDMDSWATMIESHNPFSIDLTVNQTPQIEMDYLFDPNEDFPPPMLETETKESKSPTKQKNFSIHKAKLNSMPRYLKDKVIGQDDAIDEIHKAICRYQVGLNDPNRPIGVFVFAGASGVGKTFLAKMIHEYLFSSEIPMIRIDCGEYQHKQENQKLIGAPAGYIGYDDGGFLSKAMSKTQGATVVLLDEIEKAHPDFWDTMLKLFDDGYITDAKGKDINFRNCIFILTSNLGNKKVSETEFGRQTGFTAANLGTDTQSQRIPQRDLVVRETTEAIHKHFKIELIGRLDDIIIFNHLSKDDYRKIADLEFKKIADKLEAKNYRLEWTPQAADLLVNLSSRSLRGVRSMSKVRRSNVEDSITALLISKNPSKGTLFKVDAVDGEFVLK